MSTDPLERFIQAQQLHYAGALAELRAGRKTGHWIWFVLPQLRGLGRSAMASHYGIAGRMEAEAYLAHPLLGARLREAVEAVLVHRGRAAADILGSTDAIKFRSCLTLFDAVAGPHEKLFRLALDAFFDGRADDITLALLDKEKGRRQPAPPSC